MINLKKSRVINFIQLNKQSLIKIEKDVLPGTCIEDVTKDAWKIYERVITSLVTLRSTYQTRILGGSGSGRALFNPLPWEAKQVTFINPDDSAPPTGANVQEVELSTEEFEESGPGRFRVPSKFSAALVTLNPSGYTEFSPEAPSNPVTYQANTPRQGFSTFSNGLVSLEVAASGRPFEQMFYDGRPVFNDYLTKGVQPAQFYMYDDYPIYWDAWDVADYHLESRRVPDFRDETAMELVAQGPIVGCYKWSATFGNDSKIERYTILRADTPMIE